VQKIDFDVICGISSGGLNAGVLAQAHDFPTLQEQMEQLKALWFGIKSADDLWKKKCLGFFRILFSPPLGSRSVYNVDPLKKLIKDNLDLQKLRSSPKSFGVGVCSLNTGSYRFVRKEDPDIDKFMIATSMNFTIFPPEWIRGEWWVDGGVRHLIPVGDGIDLMREAGRNKYPGQDVEYQAFVSLAEFMLQIDQKENKDVDSGLKIAGRALEMGQFQFQESALRQLQTINAILAADPLRQSLPPALQQKIYIESMVFDPTWFPTSGFAGQFEVTPAIIRSLYDHGFARAKAIWEAREATRETHKASTLSDGTHLA
jgi:predicted acylesterase/phospholipase RssA